MCDVRMKGRIFFVRIVGFVGGGAREAARARAILGACLLRSWQVEISLIEASDAVTR